MAAQFALKQRGLEAARLEKLTVKKDRKNSNAESETGGEEQGSKKKKMGKRAKRREAEELAAAATAVASAAAATAPVPAASSAIVPSGTAATADNFKICMSYSNVLFFDFIGEKEVIVVEQPWIDVVSRLSEVRDRVLLIGIRK